MVPTKGQAGAKKRSTIYQKTKRPRKANNKNQFQIRLEGSSLQNVPIDIQIYWCLKFRKRRADAKKKRK